MKSYGIGRFVAKPELKQTKDGTSVAEFQLAFNERRKVGDNIVEKAHFFDFVIWDKAADLVCKSFDKGEVINIVSATPRQDRWVDKDGNNRSRVLFRVDEFAYLPYQKRKETSKTEETVEIKE